LGIHVRIVTISLVLLLLTGCKSRSHGPVAIEADDSCASCRMAISERRYAAEIVDTDGNVYKFDDIACMLRFAHTHGMEPRTVDFYVTDYKTGKDWMDARQSYFAGLRSSVSSPMGSGLVAFRNLNDAQQLKENKFGHALTFEELRRDLDALNTDNRDMPSPRLP
jgi:copper chaperone NosL